MQKKLKIVLYNFLIAGLSFLMLCGEVNKYINPYFLAFMLALVGTNIPLYNYIFGMVCGALAYDFSLLNFINLLNILVVVIVLYVIARQRKRLRSRWFIATGILFSNIVFAITKIYSPQTLVLFIINLILEFVCYYAYSQLFRAISKRGVETRLAVDEFFGLILLIVPIASSLHGINIWGINVGYMIFAFFIMLVSVCNGSLESLSTAVIFGLAIALKSQNIVPLGIMCLWSLGTSAVRSVGRVVMVVVLILVDIVMGVYFLAYPVYRVHNLITLVLAGFIFLIIPYKILMKLKTNFSGGEIVLSLNELMRQEEGYIEKKTRRLSAVFYKIHNIYNNMLIGGLDEKEIVNVIKKGIIQK